MGRGDAHAGQVRAHGVGSLRIRTRLGPRGVDPAAAHKTQGRGREGAAPGGNRVNPAPVLSSSSDRSRKRAAPDGLGRRRRYDSDAITCLTIV